MNELIKDKSRNFKWINLKFLLLNVSFRRNFIPILSIYFLSLDSTTANQVGIFTGIGFIATLLFEVPSGYMSDIIGHKKTLILSKIAQAFSLVFYILGFYITAPYNFYIFIVASIFQTIGFAFFSGTRSALYHDILEEYGKDKEFAKLEGKLSGNVSLISVIIIFLLPFTTGIHILIPFIIWFFVDILGIFIALSIPNPKIEHKIETNKKHRTFLDLLKEANNTGLLNLSIFLGIIAGTLLGESAFRGPFLESLGYPVIYIGAVMGGSRLVWFILGHTIHHLEKYLSMRQHFFIEIFIFSIFYIIVSFLDNPYIIGALMSIVIGYKWGRSSLVKSYILKDFMKDKRYKATFFSISSMLNSIFGFIVSIVMGYCIAIHGYQLNYFYLGIILFILLSISYYTTFIKKRES